MTEATLTLDEIEARADQLRTSHGVTKPNGWVDVDAIVEHLGGDVRVTFGPSERPESLQVRTADDFTIFVAWNTSRARDRFTIGHELGHLYLHYENDGDRSFYRYGEHLTETEANAFASALLMPRAHFAQAWEELAGDLRRVANRFEVSRSSARVRAIALKLI